jgi:hypothetical protein
MSLEPDLARQITTAFVTGDFDTRGRNAPTGKGWAALPEVIAAYRLYWSLLKLAALESRR